jgi:hypothetical protein
MTHAARRLLPALLLALALPAAADTTISHGISAFGELKYPPDFPHFDYVNPDAPKGGTMSFRGTGASRPSTASTLFILKGEPAQGLGLIYDTLLVRAVDEPDAVYGLLAEKIEYPEDRSWVVFTLREGATFADGHPVTSEDVVFTFATLKEKGAPRYQIDLRTWPPSPRSRPARSGSTSRRARDARPHRQRRHLRDPARALLRDRAVRGLDARAAPRLGTLRRHPRRPRPLRHLLPERGLLGRGPARERRQQQLRLHPLRLLRRLHRRLRGAEGRQLPLPRGELLGPVGHRLRLPRAHPRMGDPGGDPGRPPLGRAGLLVQHAAREVPGPPRPRSDRHDVQLRMVGRDAVLRPLRPHRQLLGEHHHAGRRPARRRGTGLPRTLPRPPARHRLLRARLHAPGQRHEPRSTAGSPAARARSSTRRDGRSAPTASAATRPGRR